MGRLAMQEGIFHVFGTFKIKGHTRIDRISGAVMNVFSSIRAM
jgi:hypothetical protein